MPPIVNRRFPKAAPGLVAIFLAAAIGTLGPVVVQAHKTVTSKYTYNEDVFPIFRDRCGSCHAAGGATPMSLLTYKEALPWSESIREELTSERMPPWYVDHQSRSVRGSRAITAREIDTILTWATGGTPEGNPDKQPSSSAFHAEWKLGAPDLSLSMPESHTVAATLPEETCRIVLPTNLAEAKWLRAADLLPGTPDMVRDATISIENGPAIATWISGEESFATPVGTAFELPARAVIELKIHYKKPWQEAQVARTDRSTVGLYFVGGSEAPAEIHSLVSKRSSVQPSESAIAVPLSASARVIALTPMLDRPYESLDVRAVTPTGAAIPLLLLHAPRPEWQRRYWLTEGVELPAGSRIEANVKLDATASNPASPVTQMPLELGIDYLSR